MFDAGRLLELQGVPRPDGTPVGDALHVLAVFEGLGDDFCVCRATSNVYGEGEVTGLSLGDLRHLVVLAELGLQIEELIGKRSKQV